VYNVWLGFCIGRDIHIRRLEIKGEG
jgi:hypothetical protein